MSLSDIKLAPGKAIVRLLSCLWGKTGMKACLASLPSEVDKSKKAMLDRGALGKVIVGVPVSF